MSTGAHFELYFLHLTSDSDVDDVAAVSVFRFTPVHSSVGLFDRLNVTGRGILGAPA